ncbi:hypothetical protein [Paludibacterium purpuratum]|uniref:hypothetical protein n=1 Tax=Paludibacterium purpuratum TaxID=1144873 RepID=UPI001AACF660|nr:hypothetical protein [Paludibacterium purpuratum]
MFDVVRFFKAGMSGLFVVPDKLLDFVSQPATVTPSPKTQDIADVAKYCQPDRGRIAGA